MNQAHLHLILNHFPTIGLGVGFGLFVGAFVARSDDLRRASLTVLFVIALLAVPAYLTGNAAHFVLRDQEAAVSEDVIAAHQDAAMLALIFMELTGAAAWAALWRFRTWKMPFVLVLSIVTLGLMARAAAIGGEIRHPEILGAGTVASAPGSLRVAALGAALVVDNPWVWPICEIFHFVGLCLVFGVMALVNLRTLGFIQGVAMADMRQLLPWAMAGLGINVVIGMLFVLASPDQYTQNPSFHWKIGVMLLPALTLLHTTISDQGREQAAGARMSLTARIVAAGSIILWVGMIFLGRFLPYLGSE